MSKNPPAFPVQWDYAENETGMTLRDYFAGQALAAISRSDVTTPEVRKGTAEWAYQTADAMLAVRSVS